MAAPPHRLPHPALPTDVPCKIISTTRFGRYVATKKTPELNHLRLSDEERTGHPAAVEHGKLRVQTMDAFAQAGPKSAVALPFKHGCVRQRNNQSIFSCRFVGNGPVRRIIFQS